MNLLFLIVNELCPSVLRDAKRVIQPVFRGPRQRGGGQLFHSTCLVLPPFKEKLSAREREKLVHSHFTSRQAALSLAFVEIQPIGNFDRTSSTSDSGFRMQISRGGSLATDTFNSPDANFEGNRGNRGFLTSSSSTHTPLSSHICNRPLKSFLMTHSSTHLSITESKIISKTVLLIILINLTNAINPQKSL